MRSTLWITNSRLAIRIIEGFCLLAILLVVSSGCKPTEVAAPPDFSIETWENYGPENPDPSLTVYELDNGEPSHVTVQHVLITYTGRAEKKKDQRSKEESQKLAMEVLAMAKAGDDFDKLVDTYSEDPGAGIYTMANSSIEVPPPSADRKKQIRARGQMVTEFGDVGFSLKIGEIGITKEGKGSPFGWHIIKRLK